MKKLPLWLRVLIGMALGVITGFAIGPGISDYVKPVGDLFINAIQMLVVPLVLATLICGVAGMSDPKKMGRIGIKVLVTLIFLTATATTLGLVMANAVIDAKPITQKEAAADNKVDKEHAEMSKNNKHALKMEENISLEITGFHSAEMTELRRTNPQMADKIDNVMSKAVINASVVLPEDMGHHTDLDDDDDGTPLTNILKNIIPSNPVKSMADGNILQIIIFALFLGICISTIGERGKIIYSFFDSLAEAMFVMVGGVMKFAPLGVFCLMAWVTSNFGIDTLKQLAMVVVAVYIACIIQGVLVYGGIIALSGLNPKQYFRGIIDVLTFAFATSSSAGTLPVTINCSEKNLGVPNSIGSFVLPLCATINMSGTAIYEGVCAVFIAQLYGVELTLASYGIIIVTSILAAIGTAGVPGSGLIMLSLVLSSVGIPLEGIALIAGVDRILDMARTTLNVMGDTVVATLVSKSEGELDLEVFNNPVNIEE